VLLLLLLVVVVVVVVVGVGVVVVVVVVVVAVVVVMLLLLGQPRGLVGFFLEGEYSHDDHGMGSLAGPRFKTPPGTSYSYITIHLIGTT
jgi:hypothetical protein